MALGVALVVAVLVVYGVVEQLVRQGPAEGFDMIVGAKGSKLQLVLNTVYHLSSPVENIPWSYYKEFKPGGQLCSPGRKRRFPTAWVTTIEKYRVVGTTRRCSKSTTPPGEATASPPGEISSPTISSTPSSAPRRPANRA